MMVTTGGRRARSSGLSSVSRMNSSSSNPTFSTFHPLSMASRLAVSKSMGWFCVTIFPPAISLRIKSALFTPMVWESSATVIVSSMRITFLRSAISVISVCLPFLALFFLCPRTGTYARWRARSTRSCLESDSVFSTRGPFLPRCPGPPLLSLVTSMNSRPRPGPPETTASSRTSPTGRGRKLPPPGPRGAGLATGISGRDSTTARVAVGRDRAGLRLGRGDGGRRRLGLADLHGARRRFCGDDRLRGQRGGVLVLGGGVRLLAAEDHAAPGRLGRLDLGALLALELLDDR